MQTKRQLSIRLVLGFLASGLISTSGCRGSVTDEEIAEQTIATAPRLTREPCRDRDPQRRALFGDLHVHTSYSMDAFLFDTRSTPRDAYRFAQGETIAIAPLDAEGKSTRPQKIDRPLDFAAVTDHAENIANVALCTRPESPVFSSESCRVYRGENVEERPTSFLDLVRFVKRRSLASLSDEVCGEDGRRCRDAIDAPWQDIQTAAESFYDRSEECAFTTFVAYEYSLSPEMSKVHRNIVFKSEITLPRPIHALDEPEPLVMLRRLRDECVDGIDGCDVISIPHNSNLSDGRMFRTEYPGTTNRIEEVRSARLRAEMEPVVEIMQIKGDSECRNGLSGVNGVDELCNFEKMRGMTSTAIPDCEGEIGSGALIGKGCVDRNDFARYALIAGLAEEERLGVNPFQFGFGASTDEHDGTMGNVGEWTDAAGEDASASRTNTNPGGLFGVYAEENSRVSIFDALARRETFGTSGPRIEPRFYGGWDLDADLCDRPDTIARADAEGEPMGGLLSNRGILPGDAPHFLVSALKDTGTPEHPGGQLERIQIVKGWVGENGVYEQRVYDVAGSVAQSSALDLDTCEPSGAGSDSLCSIWTDPEFDRDKRAVYYSRVLEMPSCRWTRLLCLQLDTSERPSSCEDPLLPQSIRERAWTSPIWYSPAPEMENVDIAAQSEH